MGNCPCSSKSNVVPHSDLFVPQFDVTVNAPHSKKLMRLKSLKQPSETHKMKFQRKNSSELKLCSETQ